MMVSRRKRSTWLCITSAVIFFCYLYFSVNLFKDKLSALAAGPSALQTGLLVLAYMRTGSSMTGRILQASPHVFYWFEPLHTLERYYVTGGKPDSPYRNRTLNEYFKASAIAGGNVSACLSCDITHVYNRTLLDGFMMLSKYGTRHFLSCFQKANNSPSEWRSCALNMTHVCRTKFKVTAVKSIRLHMSRAKEAMQRDPKVKVVHLVRDPRAVLLSRHELGFADFKNLKSEADLLCGKFREDLNVAKAMDASLKARYRLVRYEDIAGDPMSHTHQLYGFMGLAPSQEVLNAVKNMMISAKKSRKCPTCPLTPLNSTEVAQAWRHKMTFNDVDVISQACTEVLKDLGYRKHFRDDAQLKDLGISAVGPVKVSMD